MEEEIIEEELGNNGEEIPNPNPEPDEVAPGELEVFVDDEEVDPNTTVEEAQKSHAMNTTDNLFT